ncbi:MAG: pectate lyase [Myxococcales bacterium]
MRCFCRPLPRRIASSSSPRPRAGTERWRTAVILCATTLVGLSAGCGSDPGSGKNDAGFAGGASLNSGGAPGDTGGAAAPGTGGADAAGTGGRGTGGQITASGGSPARSGGHGGGAGAAATGGRPGSGGSSSGGTSPGSGGAQAGGGTSGGGGTSVSTLCTWPTPVGTDQPLTATKPVSDTFDGGMQRFVGSGPLGTAGQTEDQGPLFNLANGATLKNVILGNPAADGVHCAGTCTLINVWWEDVGEDAATLKGSSATQVMTIDGGGAAHAADKVFQHNGPGTMIIKNFCAQDFGKLYRSCGNCGTQYTRHAQFDNVMLTPRSSSVVASVNSNYHDTALFRNVTIKAAVNAITVCQRYTGNDTGDEPPKNGSGADGTVCMYAPADIIWQ